METLRKIKDWYITPHTTWQGIHYTLLAAVILNLINEWVL